MGKEKKVGKMVRMAIEAATDLGPREAVDVLVRAAMTTVIDMDEPELEMCKIAFALQTCGYMAAMVVTGHDYEKAIEMSKDVLLKAVDIYMTEEVPKALAKAKGAKVAVPLAITQSVELYARHKANRAEVENASPAQSKVAT
jgi:hypothetical protein